MSECKGSGFFPTTKRRQSAEPSDQQPTSGRQRDNVHVSSHLDVVSGATAMILAENLKVVRSRTQVTEIERILVRRCASGSHSTANIVAVQPDEDSIVHTQRRHDIAQAKRSAFQFVDDRGFGVCRPVSRNILRSAP